MAYSDYDFAAWNSHGQQTGMSETFSAKLKICVSKIYLKVETTGADIQQYFDAKKPGIHEDDAVIVAVAWSGRASFFLACVKGETPKFFGAITRSGWKDAFNTKEVVRQKYGLTKKAVVDVCHSCLSDGTLVVDTHNHGTLTWFRPMVPGYCENTPERLVQCGIEREDFAAYLVWAESQVDLMADRIGNRTAIQDWINTVRAAGCLRCNQGDAWLLGHHLNDDDTIGETDEADVASALSPLGDPISSIAAQLMGFQNASSGKMPHRSFSEWLDERVLWSLSQRGRKTLLRPGLSKKAAPAAWKRLKHSKRWSSWHSQRGWPEELRI